MAVNMWRLSVHNFLLWTTSVLIAMLLWIPFAVAADVSPAPQSVGITWESLLNSGPIVTVLAFVVRWFMSHVENKDRAFVDMLVRKEKAYEDLTTKVMESQSHLADVIGRVLDDHNAKSGRSS